jgi:hypothetical protein
LPCWSWAGLIGGRELVAEQDENRRGGKILRRASPVAATVTGGEPACRSRSAAWSADTIRPIVTVVAPTTPFAAASSVPTMATEMPRTATQRAEQPAHGLEQFLRRCASARSITPMKMNSGNRQQHLVGHHAEDALRQRAG